MLAFIIWALLGVAFLILGICAVFSKKEMPFGFWANVKTFPVINMKAYNRAVGKLWIVYGIIFMLLGLPLFSGQNSPYVLLSILGIMVETIAAMVVYTVVIEPKYREKS